MRSWYLLTDEECVYGDLEAIEERSRSIERSGGRVIGAHRRFDELGGTQISIDIPEDPTGLLL